MIKQNDRKSARIALFGCYGLAAGMALGTVAGAVVGNVVALGLSGMLLGGAADAVFGVSQGRKLVKYLDN